MFQMLPGGDCRLGWLGSVGYGAGQREIADGRGGGAVRGIVGAAAVEGVQDVKRGNGAQTAT